VFSLLFWYTSLFNLGSFNFDGAKQNINFFQSFFISEITFISYDIGFFPISIMKSFVLLEAFLAQVIILTFIFIIFGKLWDKIEKE